MDEGGGLGVTDVLVLLCVGVPQCLDVGAYLRQTLVHLG